MAQAREAWKANQADLNPDKLVFIDETGASTKMVRLRGRCRRGQRLLAKAPFGHWKTTTFTAGLRREGLVAPFVLDGPMNGEAFLVYVEKILVPALRPDEIVVMDNLPAHKVAGVRKLVNGGEIPGRLGGVKAGQERGGYAGMKRGPMGPLFMPAAKIFSHLCGGDFAGLRIHDFTCRLIVGARTRELAAARGLGEAIAFAVHRQNMDMVS